MTLRFQVALQVMPACIIVCVNDDRAPGQSYHDYCAKQALKMADALHAAALQEPAT
jgi:hypothetical protein